MKKLIFFLLLLCLALPFFACDNDDADNSDGEPSVIEQPVGTFARVELVSSGEGFYSSVLSSVLPNREIIMRFIGDPGVECSFSSNTGEFSPYDTGFTFVTDSFDGMYHYYTTYKQHGGSYTLWRPDEASVGEGVDYIRADMTKDGEIVGFALFRVTVYSIDVATAEMLYQYIFTADDMERGITAEFVDERIDDLIARDRCGETVGDVTPVNDASPVIVITSHHFSTAGEGGGVVFETFGSASDIVCSITADSGNLYRIADGVSYSEENSLGKNASFTGNGDVMWLPEWYDSESGVPQERSFVYITAVFRKSDGQIIGFSLIEIEDDGWGTADARMLYRCSLRKNNGEYQEISDFYIERRVIELTELSRREHEAEEKPEELPIKEEMFDVYADMIVESVGADILDHDGNFGVTMRFDADEGIVCRLSPASGKIGDPLSPEYELSGSLSDGDRAYWSTDGEGYVTATYYDGDDIVGFAVIKCSPVVEEYFFPRIDGKRQAVTESYVKARAEEIANGGKTPEESFAETIFVGIGRISFLEYGNAVEFDFKCYYSDIVCSVSADVGILERHYNMPDDEQNLNWDFVWTSDDEASGRGEARIAAIYIDSKTQIPVGYSVIKLTSDKDAGWHAEIAYEGIFPYVGGAPQHVTADYILFRADAIVYG